MARLCDSCKKPCPDHLAECPHCHSRLPAGTQPAGGGQSAGAAVPSSSDSEIDLGSPVTAPNDLSGPPSGASFESWLSLVPGAPKSIDTGEEEDQPPVRFDPLDGSKIIGGSEDQPAGEPPMRDSAIEIDLGSPVGTGQGDGGRPSGASLVPWTTLVPSQPESEDSEGPAGSPGTPRLHRQERLLNAAGPATPVPGKELRPSTLETPSPSPNGPAPGIYSKATTLAQLRRALVGGVLIGIVLGWATALGLWLAGFEPPRSWRLGHAREPSPGTSAARE